MTATTTTHDLVEELVPTVERLYDRHLGATKAWLPHELIPWERAVESKPREAFNEAKAYKAEWDVYTASVARGEHPLPPRKDLKLEPLKEVLEGKRYVHAHCYLSLIHISEPTRPY